jgi:Protein of unknown function (DUF2934)
MIGAKTIRNAPHPQDLRIRAVLGNELKNKMHDAVAWRAFELYERQGGAAGHDIENWERAEAEVVRPLDCGVIVQDHRVCLTADASLFDDGPIELHVEPRRVTLCGFDRTRRPLPTPPGPEASGPVPPRRDWIFRVHEFDVDLDPAEVVARFNGPVLNIYLGKAGVRQEKHAMAAA